MNEQYGYELMLWYHKNKRDLPWRRQKNPYYIWVSEIMLQQTRVEAVIPYYERFIKALPNINALATCDDEKLRKLWQGLGYYRRCENMKKAAIQIMNEYDGIIPNTYERLLTLKGIGPYTAAAIASIAYDQNCIAIDGNVLRVFTRILNCDKDITQIATKKYLESKIKTYVSHDYGTFNQAMMELGATICIPNGKPKCIECVFMHQCLGYQKQNYNLYPQKKKTKLRKQQPITVIILSCDDEILIHKRDEKGLLANLYEFITLDRHMMISEVIEMYQESQIMEYEMLERRKHIFTHIEWDMIGYYIKIKHKTLGMWVKRSELKQYPFPSAFLKYLLDIC